ncbi:hypothetical protein J45TS6_48210 [Paenibacillus sp. J45TS6]|uniref:hypothetical protein n=1 Tax=Paenibacillus sp. J45TS6 TaxID=2807196 RepID=UPI001B0DDD95|nr:hypothetical protein [Paenibacillus sp. J45TS6]GIP46362.1 hypothetical protein J45TS6_48210 [Paenibacillus sp. J45TS6]
MEQKQYVITKKDRKSQLAATILLFLMLLGISVLQRKTDHLLLHVLSFVLILVYIVLIGYELYYYFTYTRTRREQLLIIKEDRLILQGEVVFPSQIDLIVSEGYINSSIGIKLKKRKWIPQRLQFIFANPNKEQEAFDQLQEWADTYQIEIREGKIRSII